MQVDVYIEKIKAPHTLRESRLLLCTAVFAHGFCCIESLTFKSITICRVPPYYIIASNPACSSDISAAPDNVAKNPLGKPGAASSDQFCCRAFLSGQTGSRGIACEQDRNIFAKIVSDEHIGGHLDIGNENRNYWLAMRSGKFDITPSTLRESACWISSGVSAV